jgi:flagellar basal-body rod protein FlgC
MDLISSMEISASALSAQRTRLNIISQNLANANTTRTHTGEAYRRKVTVFKAEPFVSHLTDAMNGPSYPNGKDPRHGVLVDGIETDMSPFRQVFDPQHPDSNDEGYVFYPNVNVVTEMTNMINASRSYEANVTVVNAAKRMALKALDIGR